MYVDPSKTITAPYNQGVGFWTECRSTIVAMSFWPEIYNNKQGISSMNDLIQIMSIVNQLYSSLSQLAILLDTEKYSKRYTSIVHRGIFFTVLFLLTKSFGITVISKLHQLNCNSGMYWGFSLLKVDVRFKIFDSLARDVITPNMFS